MTTVLYGECIGPRESAPVRISELADQGCDVETDRPIATDGEVSLWIGAIGPLAGMATRRDDSHLVVRFKEPLDDRILEHFKG